MVFTRLSSSDKEAFFELLDEYFTSRPEIFAGSGEVASESGPSPPANQAASAVHRALASNPEATASLITAGLRHSAAAHSSSNAGGMGRTPSGTSSAVASAASNPEISNAIGRVAAASLAFSAPKPGGGGYGGGLGKPPAPPVLPRRTSHPPPSEERSSPSPDPPPAHSPVVRPKIGGTNETAKLSTTRAMGSLNTTSFGKSVSSLVSSKSKGPVAPPIPSAFAKKPMDLPPPPVRRVSASPSPVPEPEPEPEEEEEEGEWAEALYDYDSGEAGDLVVRAHDRIKVTSRDSDDWYPHSFIVDFSLTFTLHSRWTGEIDGRSGLFPASYAKLL
ncbi:hypothetical protein SCHPADRAFT_247019 [Schizopora paradoxa]|uniref:SH3 domain-containing protein n=1 Tax=Schizopora paradoxa TaxID=27342 RepID=A0A0H2SF68_9AGAM|nr:hypothetical protein SCHPADRAFT_247019 [Schizopora paradoxa]